MDAFNAEAIKLAAMGVTITVASGDNGAVNFGCSCTADSSSTFSRWRRSPSWTGQGYFPSFPATCPYVTAVGATMGKGVIPIVGEPEVACQVGM